MVTFLRTPAAPMIRGQVILVEGGYSLPLRAPGQGDGLPLLEALAAGSTFSLALPLGAGSSLELCVGR